MQSSFWLMSLNFEWLMAVLSRASMRLIYCVLTGQGASQACNRLSDLQEFKSSQTIKVNPDRPQQQARFVTLEVSWLWGKKKTKKLSSALLPSSPLNQGAFTACARVSELQVFTQTAEVKVDPDKPLEGARLAVLQVALCRKTPRVSHIITFIYVLHLYLSCNHVNLTCMELETVLEIQRII